MIRKEIVEPEADPYTVICPRTGWRVPMIGTRQVHEKSRTILDLVPEPTKKAYSITTRSQVDDFTWESAARGTVVREDDDFFLMHNTGKGQTRVRIANRAKAYLYCVEIEDPATGWRVPLAPSWIISKNYKTVAKLVPDAKAKRFDIVVDSNADDTAINAAAAGTISGSDIIYWIEGRKEVAKIEELRGDVQLLSANAYRNEQERARAAARLSRCRNRYSDTSGNDLRPWELPDVLPRPGDPLSGAPLCGPMDKTRWELLLCRSEQRGQRSGGGRGDNG